MSIEVKVPVLGESISSADVLAINCKVGQFVKKDEALLELETEKVTLEVYSPADGVVEKILCQKGDSVTCDALLVVLTAGLAKEIIATKTNEPTKDSKAIETIPHHPIQTNANPPAAPSAIRVAYENNLSLAEVKGTGIREQILKQDVVYAIDKRQNAPQNQVKAGGEGTNAYGRVERVRMSKLRQTIASRLKSAQNTAAILTTFNEIDMQNVMNLRTKYKDAFEKKHGVKLGFMSFFVKAAVISLTKIPAINAEISEGEILYKNYYNLGVAVGTESGLVVPVLKNAENMSLADVERNIGIFANRAKEGKLTMHDMADGTFTISNGGVYGSLLSTPIINPPQSGILGLHNIVNRPVAIDGKVEIRPMMYIALSYDHRMVDGKEAVTFLVNIKQLLEDPQRLLLDL